MRGKVSTQRYSIPGFPSLYLGRTLYAAWEEMRRPSIAEFQAVRLESTERIQYLDLTRPLFPENVKAQEIYRYFMTWPLIACCSVKVKEYNDFFKPEYIIPQLLLQWVRNTNQVDGIRYNSTHIDFHKSKSEGDFSNLVLPVKQNMQMGHCPELKRIFKVTEPITWQLREYALGGQLFMHSGKDFERINSKIPKLELIKGRAYPYNYSTLGMLEYFLDGMQTYELT